MKILLPLYVHPLDDPAAWQAERLRGATVVVNVHDGPGQGNDRAYLRTTARLAAADVPMLGYVDLRHATRPLGDVLDDVDIWTGYPVSGIFFDRAPTSAFSIGPVALAVRVARRAGLSEIMVNPGLPTDEVYRDLRASICTFEGSWADYRRWSGRGSRPGDCHLVRGVPLAEIPAARHLLELREAGFGLATDREMPHPYAGLPAGLDALAPAH
jgi:hypothetical protein